MSAPKTKCGGCGEYIYGTHTPYDCIDALRSALEQAQRERNEWNSAAGTAARDCAFLSMSLAAAQAENARLREALGTIWTAHGVVVANGGSGWSRHVEPAIYEAHNLILSPRTPTDALDEYGRRVAEAIVHDVNARAEADMLAGNPITGAHHRALDSLDVAAILKGARG